jgi:cytochrome c oxidase subunit 3
LLSSGVTLTWAHWGLKKTCRKILIIGLCLTILLGLTFLILQANEYYQAYTVHQLTLNAGSYGSLFFLLTGFHGTHVTIGVTMLIVILVRSSMGHFTPDNHFAFLGVAWYWHFVDVVWLLLYILLYWL